MAEKVIGIDLGTTNTCVALVEENNPLVIANKGSYDTTPSMVALAETGRRLVGFMAKRQAITNSSNTAFAFKRLIGRKFNSPEVENLRSNLPYNLVSGKNGDVRIVLRDQKYSIAELSSFILSEMKSVAEEYLGSKVTKAVVTVPAYFTDSQRQATKDSGKIAELDIIRIINEPTAAALAYGFGKDIEKRIAIYDLGGGTFDISVLDIGNGVFEVISTAGDSLLGGEDFDRRIMDWIVFNFAKENHIDLRKDKMALQRLKDISEKTKCELSTLQESEINLPFIISTGKSDPYHLKTRLTRDKLEQLTSDLVERTIRICKSSLEKSSIALSSIDTIILVGGMTRMPIVQDKVKEFFGKKPSKGVHPDEVVALGAAIQGNSLVNNDEKKEELLLLDVTSHSIGIKTSGGAFYKIIEANTTIPTSEKQIFTNVLKNQQAVKIIVFQGENSIADKNELLGEFTLTGLRPAEKGDLDIEVSFEINANGIVTVQAKDLATGKMQEITITAKSNLSDQEIKDIIQKNKDNKKITDGKSSKKETTPKTKVPQEKEKTISRKRKSTADINSNFSLNMGTPTAKVPKPAPLDDSAGIPEKPPSQNEDDDVIFSTKPLGSLNFDTVNIKSGIKKINEEQPEEKPALAKPAFVNQPENSNRNKLEEYVKMIRENLEKVKPMIKNTSYGPEALKKAKESLGEGQEILDSGLAESTSEFQSCEKKLKRISNMFKTILQRLS